MHHCADTVGYNFGQSVVWLVDPRFNVLLETVYGSSQPVIAPDQTEWNKSLYISPGIRWAYNFKSGCRLCRTSPYPSAPDRLRVKRGFFSI